MVSGSNYSSKVNIIRKGISIRDHLTLSQLPQVQSQGGLHCIGDKLLIRLAGFESPILAKAEMNGCVLAINEVELPTVLNDIAADEEILLVKESLDQTVIVTDEKIMLVSK